MLFLLAFLLLALAVTVALLLPLWRIKAKPSRKLVASLWLATMLILGGFAAYLCSSRTVVSADIAEPIGGLLNRVAEATLYAQDDPESWRRLAILSQLAGESDRSQLAWQKVLALKPGDPEAEAALNGRGAAERQSPPALRAPPPAPSAPPRPKAAE